MLFPGPNMSKYAQYKFISSKTQKPNSVNNFTFSYFSLKQIEFTPLYNQSLYTES